MSHASRRNARRDRPARRGRHEAPTPPPLAGACPTPDKRRFADEPDAARAARLVARSMLERREYFAPIYGHLCMCGAWHFTNWPGRGDAPNVLLYAVADHLQAFAGVPVPTPVDPTSSADAAS
jgi:hypothetical protein